MKIKAIPSIIGALALDCCGISLALASRREDRLELRRMAEGFRGKLVRFDELPRLGRGRSSSEGSVRTNWSVPGEGNACDIISVTQYDQY